MPITRRPQRRAALQASQHLAYAALHGPLQAPINDDEQLASRRSDVAQAQGNRWFTSERDEGKAGAVEEWRSRRIKRRLNDLERTNAHDLPSTAFPITARPTDDAASSHGSPTPTETAGSVVPQSVARLQRRKNDRRKRGMMTPNVKTLVQYRKTLREYLNELPSTTPYLTSTAPFPTHPPRKTCTACAHPEGRYACARCGEYACSRACWVAHREVAVGEGGCGIGMQGMVGFS